MGGSSRFLVIASLISMLLLCFSLSSCWSSKKSMEQQVRVGLSWVHEAQFAGLYVADQEGYYRKEGLRINLSPFSDEDLTAGLLAGKYDFVFLQTESLLLAREMNEPIVAVFADYRIIPTVYFSKKSRNITKPRDLIGKTVGVAYSEKYPLIAMLNNAGINPLEVNIVEREYDYEKLANDEYDAEAGWVTDGDTVSEACGEYNIISPYDYDVNWYADIIVTTEDLIEKKPELVQAFVRATLKGWQSTFENPEAAALLTKKYNPLAADEHLKFVLSESMPLMHLGDANLGWMDGRVFAQSQQMLLNQNIMRTPVDVEKLFTNKFIEKAANPD